MGVIIPGIIIIVSFGGILTIIAKKARALSQETGGALVHPDFVDKKRLFEKYEHDKKEYLFLKIFHNIKEGETFFILIEKFIRRTQVRLMRIENWLGSLISRLRERNRQKREGDGQGPASNGTGRGGGASFISLYTEPGDAQDEQYWLGVIKQDPQSSHPYKKLGDIYLAREDFHEARSVLKYALRLDPRDTETQAKMENLRGKRTPNKSLRSGTGQAKKK